ncbi:KipI family sensor histidine kinase inhibitor [Microbacterium amylolyticum]|uniref:KipI family sensor histidine kinase inhibitor n=2 Tax=Microbacterium amylolyticum TaxID=936337 RepID=A0ABS4ZKX6_9MICO|nr:KipI family sensor histidine kinase inhibitor [Microbacterium amylolyticum]
MTEMRRAGERGLLLEAPSLAGVMALHARLLAEPLAGQLDAVAAARTVLVTFQTARHARRAEAIIPVLEVPENEVAAGRDIEIEVEYNGEDLADVADMTGMSVAAVINAHTDTPWRAAFGGFAPGFAYLADGDTRLQVSRRETPRTHVPAGSVGLAGEFSAVYPRASPGGWRLIGRTDAAMWDQRRDSPALVRPGDTVRFRAVRATTTIASATRAQRSAEPDMSAPDSAHGLQIDAPGPRSLVQDRGRPGHADLGVTASGAADTASALSANRLVGNDRDAAVIESLLGGLTVTARGDQVLALTGAIAGAHIGEEEIAFGSPFLLRNGETLTVGTPDHGLLTYVAVRGGIDVPAFLGSRSADTLSGIGTPALAAGQMLAVGSSTAGAVGAPEEPATETRTLRVIPGPRTEWLPDGEFDAFLGMSWVVSDEVNRVGIRLESAADGRALRRRQGELPSEGMVRGAIQVPPSGMPVIFGPDHPVTGGYPVIAVVIDTDAAAQLRPGESIRFAV